MQWQLPTKTRMSCGAMFAVKAGVCGSGPTSVLVPAVPTVQRHASPAMAFGGIDDCPSRIPRRDIQCVPVRDRWLSIGSSSTNKMNGSALYCSPAVA